MALHVDAGVPRAGRVVADGVGAAAKIGAVQHKGKQSGQHDKQRELKRQRAPDVALAEPGEALRVAVQRLVPEQDVGDPAVQAHGADGDDDGRQVKARHQNAVEQPAQ